MATETKNICEQPPAESTEHLKAVALRAYSRHREQPIDQERLTEFLPLVRKIARRAATYLKPPLSFEDLVSAGTVGLIKAARDFNASRKAKFETYAYIRIKGAILDELRGLSLLPSNLNKQIQGAVKASREIAQEKGASPTDAELANRLGITVEKLSRMFENSRAQNFLSIDGFAEGQPALAEVLASPGTAPDRQLEQAELIDRLAEAIRQLDTRQRQIIVLYYQQELTMKQIAELLKITESRVSQLHASAVFNLSEKLRQWKDGR